MHTKSSVREGHAAPPYHAGATNGRVRVLRPELPQVALHLPKLPQEPTWQLMGQPCPHDFFMLRCGHAKPPNFAFCDTVRERVVRPAPQVTGHADHVLHAPTMQSIGHGSSLHSIVLTRSPQLAPPPRGLVSTSRTRFRCPMPQVRSHAPAWRHPPTTQSTGQSRLLHSRVTDVDGQW